MDDCNEIKGALNKLKNVLLGSSYVFLSADANKNMASIIIDYFNMIFHLDILLYYRIEKGLFANKEDILILIERLGKIESLAAICSYRKSLKDYCIPDFNDDGTIKELYHPLMSGAVKNDADLTNNILITGSNASGKSTYLKAVALCILMAQSIHTVCASNYNLPFYRIYTSMALKDNILNGESFFMAEIKSIKRIIDNISPEGIPIIAFIDEILKGTNTTERVAASAQVTAFLDRNNVKCVFATHDIILSKLLDKHIVNVHFEENIEENDVRFTYKLCNGPSTSRNAIRLLTNLGYDNTLTENAEKMAMIYDDKKEWLMIE